MPEHLYHHPLSLVITNQADFACMQMLPHAVMFIASSDMLMTYACTPEAVQIKAPRLTIYPVTAQEVSTREHEHITRVIPYSAVFSRRKIFADCAILTFRGNNFSG